MAHAKEWWNIVKDLENQERNHVMEEAAIICWCILLARNKETFVRTRSDPLDTLRRVRGLIANCMTCFWGCEEASSKRPPMVSIKINCDVAYTDQVIRAGVAIITRSHTSAEVDAVNR